MKFAKKHNLILIISLLILGCGIGFAAGYLTRRHGILKKILQPVLWPQQSSLYSAPKQGRSEIYRKKEVDYPFSFVVYGDSREPSHIEKNDIITQIIKEDPSFVIHAGDMVEYGDESSWKLFDLYEKRISDAGIPFYPVLGNTEYQRRVVKNKKVDLDEAVSLYFNKFKFLRDNRWYSFLNGNSMFLVLDTNCNYFPGSNQYNWLMNKLKEEHSGFLFILFHHYPYGNDRKGETIFLANLFENCEINNLNKPDVIFTGHKHAYERFKKYGVNYIITGGGGAPLTGIKNYNFNDFYINAYDGLHYCRITVSKNNVLIEVVVLDKDAGKGNLKWRVFDTLTFTKDVASHSGGITSLAIDPSGKFIVSGGHDKTIRVWDSEEGKVIKTLKGHKNNIDAITIDPRGLYIISGSDDHTIKIWDLKSGKLLKTLEGHKASVDAVAIDPRGQFIVGGNDDGKVRIWDLKSGELLKTLKGHNNKIHLGKVEGIAIDPKGKFIVSGSDDHTIKIWDMKSGKLLKTLEGHKDSVDAVAIDPNGQLIVSGSTDRTVKVWDAKSGKLLKTLSGYNDDIDTVAIDPAGQYIITGSDDKTIKMWELKSGKLLKVIMEHSNKVEAIAIDPYRRFFVSGSMDKTIKIWELKSGKLLKTFY